MTNRKYFNKLSAIAHWKFSREEAVDIINDYMLLAEDAYMQGDDFMSQIGSPVQAMAQIQGMSRYRLWLLAFGWMFFCMAGLTVELFSYTQNRYWDVFLLATGVMVSVGWFFKAEKGYVYKRPVSKQIIILLLIMTILLCIEWWMFVIGNYSSSLQFADFFRFMILSIGSLSVAIGMLGIVIAKLSDRRWRSIYTVALTVLSNSVFIFSICHDITLDRTIECWYTPYILQGGSIVAIGIFATIISLF